MMWLYSRRAMRADVIVQADSYHASADYAMAKRNGECNLHPKCDVIGPMKATSNYNVTLFEVWTMMMNTKCNRARQSPMQLESSLV